MKPPAALRRLDAYLSEVRRYLTGLPKSEADEIILELRAHVLDRLDGQDVTVEAVDAALWALGSPAEIGRSNVAARVGRPLSSTSLLESVRNAIAIARAGVSLLLTLIAGGALSVGLFAFAAAKLVDPHRTGIWRDGDNWTVGRVHALVPGHEVLGWTLLPIGLIAAALIGFATCMAGRQRLREIQGRRRTGEAFR